MAKKPSPRHFDELREDYRREYARWRRDNSTRDSDRAFAEFLEEEVGLRSFVLPDGSWFAVDDPAGSWAL